MSSGEDQARLIAERIARRVTGGQRTVSPVRKQSSGDISAELSAIHLGLDNLKHKLVQLESRLSESGNSAEGYSNTIGQKSAQSWSTAGSGGSGTNPSRFASTYAPAAHPSLERFGVEEATVSELVDFFEGDKKCELEPGGKPCDHCAMCSSRGF